MEEEEEVPADSGKIRHVAAECDMSKEVRILVEPGAETEAACRRVDIELLIETVQTQPIHPEVVDPFAAIDPRPASAVKERTPWIAENKRQRKIGLITGDRVPVGKRKLFVFEHL